MRDATDRPACRGYDNTLIRIGALEQFGELLRELEVDPDAILKDVGIDPAAMAAPDELIETIRYRMALNLAAERSGQPQFGLLLSQRQTFEKFGAVGYLVRHAPDLRTSIRHFIAHYRTHDTGSITTLETEGDVAVWSHRLAGVDDESAVQQTELALGLACRFIRAALDDRWNPEAILFEHAPATDLRLYARVFRAPVRFGEAVTCVEFPAADLDRPLRLSDPGLFDILERYLCRIDEDGADDLGARVRSTIQKRIEAGPVRIDETAARLGISKHALQRRLRLQGTSFQSLLGDVRYEMGRRYLRETTMPISDISVVLGYAEPAVFTRAFTRRSGMTPRTWRQSTAVKSARTTKSSQSDQPPKIDFA